MSVRLSFLGKCSDCTISELLPASTYLLGAVKFISILWRHWIESVAKHRDKTHSPRVRAGYPWHSGRIVPGVFCTGGAYMHTNISIKQWSFSLPLLPRSPQPIPSPPYPFSTLFPAYFKTLIVYIPSMWTFVTDLWQRQWLKSLSGFICHYS